MSHRDTVRPASAAALLLAVCAASGLAQPAAAPAWRPVGNTVRLLGLPSPAGGPVERIWFSADGRLHLLLGDGRRFATSDWETWIPTAGPPPPPASALMEGLESGSAVRRLVTPSGIQYAGGRHLYRSADQGRSWLNLTEWQGGSLLGGPILDFAADPGNDARAAVATRTGVWLTQDGGRTWIGLNEGLPNLPVRAFVSLPENGRRLKVAAASGDATELMEWIPGQRAGWVPARQPDPARVLRARLSALLETPVTAAAEGPGGAFYAGTADGSIRASLDNGLTWRTFPVEGFEAEKFWVDPADGRTALAALRPGRILRTLNGGAWWDDLTADLPPGEVFGLAAHTETGAIYAATGRGLYWTLGSLRAPAPATPWSLLPGLPEGAAVRDAALDSAGVRLFAAVDGYGIWTAPAPHLAARPAAVHTADFGLRPAAPGALLSVLGTGAAEATAGGRPAAVLSSEPRETQLQIPFDVAGDSLRLSLGGGPLSFELPLRASAPAILTDRDGTPMLFDAETGLPLDAANPGRPGMAIQILATGLGRVDPDWPAGLPAPLDAPPRVRARVRVLLDGAELQVLAATLAPGYTGYYLIEARLPEFVDSGLALLAIEAAGNASPPADIHLEQ